MTSRTTPGHPLRFRILARGQFVGWISRTNQERAEETLRAIFPAGEACLEFREEDQ